MKKTIAIIFTSGILTLICACGKEQYVQGKIEIRSMADLSDKINEFNLRQGQSSNDDCQSVDLEIEDWEAAYLSYLDDLNYADSCTYSLIYVDEDEIPELVVDTGYEAGGCRIVTFHDGILDEWQSDRLNVTYIEKGNLICNSDGNMGYYYHNVYTIQDGKWRFVEGGRWGDGPDGIQFDENENWLIVYYWNGENEDAEWWSGDKISEEEYDARLNNVYPMQQARYPERYYIFKEIYSILKTDNVSSAGHRYELVVEDLTWTEAESACREKGGYLVAITSWEEFEWLQEQMIAENKTDITFFVGANNSRENGRKSGFCWIEAENGTYYNMLGSYNALFGFWLEGEPSYRGLTEAGVEVREDSVVLIYSNSDKRCYIDDVPNDILSAAPSYSGKIGYICEYDD